MIWNTLNDIKYNYKILISCFLISFNYYILKSLKDSMIITANHVGAEIIPFVKVWCLFPASILTGLLFAWCMRRYPFYQVCKFFLSLFLFVFTVFTFVLYPNIDMFLCDHAAGFMETLLPSGWGGMVALIHYWPYTIFYVFAELWGSFIFMVLLWGLINDQTSLDDSKRLFPLYLLAGNISAVVAGPVGIWLTRSSWGFTLNSSIALVIILGLITVLLLPKHEIEDTQKSESPSLLREIGSLFRSKHILNMALMGFSFNVIINLSEVIWKQELFKHCPHPADYNIYMNTITFTVGILSTIVIILLSTGILNSFGWRSSALLTPVITLVSGLFFFGLVLSPGVSLALTTLIGSAHICLKRTCRYTFYDVTREMAYTPLKASERIHGKSLICGTGSRAGRMGGSLIIQVLLLFYSSLAASIPFIMIFFTAFGCLFIKSVFSLGNILEEPLLERTK